MIVTHKYSGVFELRLSDEEQFHFGIILAGSPDLKLSTVSDMICYILTYTEQHYYETVKEPFPDGLTDPDKKC